MGYLFKQDGKACAAKTVFMLAFFVCLFKILFAGVTLGTFTLSDPDYVGMAAFLSPLSAVYGWRAQNKKKVDNV